VLDIKIGATNFFSFLYRPGEIKAQKLYIDIGKVIATDSSKINLNGAKKGEATSTAIIFVPTGRTLNKGNDKKLYIEFAKGVRSTAHTAIEEIIISNLFLSSKRWCVNEVLLFFI
jgi:hypothetical protein